MDDQPTRNTITTGEPCDLTLDDQGNLVIANLPPKHLHNLQMELDRSKSKDRKAGPEVPLAR
jgi:hypothetical protein